MTGVHTYTGLVVRRQVDIGSKSEREALCLVLDDATCFVLARHGGHAFHDPPLMALLGKRVTCQGRVEGLYLFFAEISET